MEDPRGGPIETAPAKRTGRTVLAVTAAPPPAPAAAPSPSGLSAPVTIRTLQRCRERGERFACLTCYDATTARWLERAGVPVLLVGDTAAEVILGLPGTIHAPLEFLVTITAAVKRGAPLAMVLGDMPFLSYQVDEASAIRNAGRFLTAGLADAVKLEADRSFAPLVAKMARAGIAVVGHIGSRPQQTKLRGGYLSTGRTAKEARGLLDDARALEDAGASMLLIEAVPAEVSERIVARAGVPVIGCGAGPACHGQVVVLQDILGLSDWQPAFAQPLANASSTLTEAAAAWVGRVQRNELGPHPYRMSAEELAALDRGT